MSPLARKVNAVSYSRRCARDARRRIPEALSSDELVERLAIAVERARRDELSKDERSRIADIEKARRDIYADTTVVPDREKDPKRVGEIAKRASQSSESAKVLFALTRAHQPSSGVELGTCVGISSAYQATALALDGTGTLVSLERYATLGEVARRQFENLGLSNVEVVVGTFQDELPGVLGRQPIDYAFIDGHHDEKATLRYFNQFLGVATHGALFVFDDIHWSEGMTRAWSRVQEHPRVRWSTESDRFGIVVVDVE